ncbi:hypothetical protein [Streptomyces sp. ISL-44]|uniref:hypothetical protein n=1 Tax=Streptomyces sp. ISL-44 TaxID=2819184 RepID=UPI0027E2E801|nr:hypothetical protein [Streptomyces sp. ISL-44]
MGVGVLTEVVDRDGRAGSGERASDLGADAGGSAGDEGGAALERSGLDPAPIADQRRTPFGISECRSYKLLPPFAKKVNGR